METAGPATAPPIVHEVLRSPGQPLDKGTRSYFEPRFGHDFSKVRVHIGAKAAESARAVNALAYTVGRNIVFGDGQNLYNGKKQLIAHELTHVLQQEATESANSTIANNRIASRGAADRRTEAQTTPLVTEPKSFSFLPIQKSQTEALPGHILQRTTGTPRSSTASSSSPAASAAPAAPGVSTPHQPVCGPDVSAQVRGAVALLKTTWNGWTPTQRDEACWALENVRCGDTAWDIVQLHNRTWINLDYTPICAGEHSNPGCVSTVKLDGQCHFAGSVNYVIFGHMCRLCNIWTSTMRLLIWLYKSQSGNYEGSRNWAIAGYD